MNSPDDTPPDAVAGGGHRPRRRLPVRATVRFDDSLAANDRHPLAKSSPEARAESRLRLIASILARLARTDLAR